jgi:hypothetical protein
VFEIFSQRQLLCGIICILACNNADVLVLTHITIVHAQEDGKLGLAMIFGI